MSGSYTSQHVRQHWTEDVGYADGRSSSSIDQRTSHDGFHNIIWKLCRYAGLSVSETNHVDILYWSCVVGVLATYAEAVSELKTMASTLLRLMVCDQFRLFNLFYRYTSQNVAEQNSLLRSPFRFEHMIHAQFSLKHVMHTRLVSHFHSSRRQDQKMRRHSLCDVIETLHWSICFNWWAHDLEYIHLIGNTLHQILLIGLVSWPYLPLAQL